MCWAEAVGMYFTYLLFYCSDCSRFLQTVADSIHAARRDETFRRVGDWIRNNGRYTHYPGSREVFNFTGRVNTCDTLVTNTDRKHGCHCLTPVFTGRCLRPVHTAREHG